MCKNVTSDMNEECKYKKEEDAMLCEYCEKYAADHELEIQKLATPSGRFQAAVEECNGIIGSALCRFIENEYENRYMGAPVCVIYMPEICSINTSKGKIIVELLSGDRGGDMYFEIQIRKTSEFSNIKEDELPWIGWDRSYRYHNIFLEGALAVPFAQELTFSGLFKQRFLMTTAPGVLGSMTTQRLRSASGQVFSFRQCVLKE